MLIIKIYIIFSMLAVLWFDVRKYIIPNWLVASLLVLYPIGIFMAEHPVDWMMAFVGMAIVFAVGYIVFSLRLMGAGDIKLLTVCALWVGYANLLEYIFLVGILGGVLSIALLIARRVPPSFAGKLKLKQMPRILRKGEAVPYGVAIAIAMLMTMHSGKIPLLIGY